jgi:glycogen synthase
MLQPEGLEFRGRGNFMKAGLVFSDHLFFFNDPAASEIYTW